MCARVLTFDAHGDCRNSTAAATSLFRGQRECMVIIFYTLFPVWTLFSPCVYVFVVQYIIYFTIPIKSKARHWCSCSVIVIVFELHIMLQCKAAAAHSNSDLGRQYTCDLAVFTGIQSIQYSYSISVPIHCTLYVTHLRYIHIYAWPRKN